MDKCRWCEDREADYENGLCEYCDSEVSECVICKSEEHIDSKCRHIFKDSEWRWNGSGVMGDYYDNRTAKVGLIALCEAMPRGFASALFYAIKSGRFYTFLMAPMIGSGGSMTLGGFDWPFFHPHRVREPRWEKEIVKAGEEHGDSEEVADGYHWLVSLYKDETPEANAVTLRWLMLCMGRGTEAPKR